ncbi:YheC/YheD family protein [Alicyclobacillus cycloheptanicus]|uniref:YheC/D like ATP-grasp n=1 Tax=Alicyclobacillus cycloheptanicus TaxID=1457 RepID=A0ABT9XEB8_9BACL|nr:YheC/YheD family protein [Alicyclobacillus cycloheptanicus]MDQ0188639.1 hypothetical protein [Alicyclobacillus cycloheptanicus]WDM00685.1 YheC/YheD family protein [Alicyclobacillus cycloheptanicus]
MASPDKWIGVATTVIAKRRPSAGESVLRPPIYYCWMAQRAYERGFHLVLFDPDAVHWQERRVSGWTPVDASNPFGSWKKTQTPLPAAIYENVFVHLAMRGRCRGLRKMARIQAIPLFNPPMPDKWRILRLLRARDVRVYVPETLRLSDPTAAVAQIKQWGVAYVKPIGGYGGMGVTRVEALPDDSFRVSMDRTTQGVRPSRRVVSEASLRTWLKTRTKRPHILQRGISLLTLDGRRVDFRVACQRDGNGKWQVVAIVPKLAVRGGAVSNIRAGGSKVSLEACQQMAERAGKRIPVEALERCALRIAGILSRQQPRCGIVGFDLGVDESLRVWFIEANPKPARSLLSDVQRRRSAQLNADFACCLATSSN